MENPPGQIVNPPEWPFPTGRVKKLSDIIDRVQRQEQMVDKSNYDKGYADGYQDGQAAGFKEGMQWIKGT